MSNFVKILPVGTELFHTASRANNHDEGIAQFCEGTFWEK